jgi:predicted dehydrogenase
MTHLSLLIVGGGRLTESGYLPALTVTAGMSPTVVVDPDPARREQMVRVAADLGLGRIATAATIDEAIDSHRTDGAIVASPVGSHVALAAALASANMPTLVEKPPANDAAGAAQLTTLEPAPSIGFCRRFDPGASAVRDAVTSAGADIDLRLTIHYRRGSWGAVTTRDDALLDLGPHLVDWALWMTGSAVESVSCTELSSERARLELTLTRGRVLVDAATDRPWREVAELRRHDGRIAARHHLGGHVDGIAARVRPARGPSPLVRCLTAQLVAFARSATGRPPDPRLATAHDGAAVMAVIDAARSSAAADGRPIAPLQET